jgi:hypothetical protein
VAGLAHLVLNDDDTSASGFNARYHVANKPLLSVAYEAVSIGSTLTSPWAAVLAQNSRGGVQILAAFVTESGGLRYHVEQQVIPWLTQHARFAFSNRQALLCGCYSDDMDMLTLQTLVASLEKIAAWNWQQPALQWEGRRESMLALLSQVERFTFQPRFQVSNDAVLIAQSLSRSPDLKTTHGAVQNALSLVIDRIARMRRPNLKRFGLSRAVLYFGDRSG